MHVVLERAVNEISSEIRELDAETTQLHPKGLSYKWSAQQVIEHLVLSYRFTTEGLEARLNKGLSRNRTRGVPALDETMPTPGSFAAMNGRQLEHLLRQEMGAMDAVLDRCRRKFGMERVSTHPWLGPLRVDQWRRFHIVHGLHHVTQLRSVIELVSPSPAPVRITRENLVEKLQIPAQRPLA
jgi:hypothetical protein